MWDFIHKLKSDRRRAIVLAAALASVSVAIICYGIWRLNSRIDSERGRQAEAAQVTVRETKLRAPSADGFTLYLNASDVRAAASFSGTRYLATAGGLIALDDGGGVRRRYTTLDGLTDNDLTALAVFRDKLFVGTATAGLLAFDGREFTAYRFEKPAATRVSVLRATQSELLIGTLDGGLFEFDGERFSRRFNSATGADFSRVTALLPVESRLYIGTQDRGLYVWREAQVESIGTAGGLPSPRGTALEQLPEGFAGAGSVAVATDFGVVGLTESNEVKPISNQPNVTSLATTGGRLWGGLFSGGVVDLSGDHAGRNGKAGEDRSPLAEVAGLPRQAPVSISAGPDGFWALTTEGAFVRDERAAGPAFESVAGSLAGESALTSDHITGLALDGVGRLWVGYFDRGIDIISPETGERLSRVADDRVREVNFVLFDPSEDRVMAATSRGLVIFDGRLKQTVLTREKSGLISDSVAHVSLTQSGASADPSIVLATAGGLTQVAGGRARSITAFHGLASNHLYCAATVGSRLFVGSLAGLVEMEGLRVVRTYKTSNSRLSHDWVTALREADGVLYVGTNGGGVDALLPTGEWVSFADDVGRVEVNQNAMHYDGRWLYVGTGGGGLLVYNTSARRWSRISAGLPSQSITAIISDEQFLYVGTLNGLMRIEKRVID